MEQTFRSFTHCGCFRSSEPFSTNAGPASHRVRLWRGGSASKVLLHRLFFPQVRLHGRPEVCNFPWLLLWSRGGRRDCAAGGHRSFCDPVCSQSAPRNLLFFPSKMSLRICPGGRSSSWPASNDVRRWLTRSVLTSCLSPLEGSELRRLWDCRTSRKSSMRKWLQFGRHSRNPAARSSAWSEGS